MLSSHASLPAPALLAEGPAVTTRKLSVKEWTVGFMLFPLGPFICLRRARAIGWGTFWLGLLAAIAVQAGFAWLLAETKQDPPQFSVFLLKLACDYLLGGWQYRLGRRAGCWSAEGLKNWRWIGRFMGGLLLLALILNIVAFLAWR